MLGGLQAGPGASVLSTGNASTSELASFVGL